VECTLTGRGLGVLEWFTGRGQGVLKRYISREGAGSSGVVNWCWAGSCGGVLHWHGGGWEFWSGTLVGIGELWSVRLAGRGL
jgi:hypothetical protein